jgi:methyl-accepting chemotaxis protein
MFDEQAGNKMRILRYRNWKILPKIMSLSCISVSFMAVLTLVYLLPLYERKMMEQKKTAIKDVVEVAYGIIAVYDGRARAGEMPLEEAQKQAVLSIKKLRYKENEYFWINDLAPKMVMHPIRPELDGKDLSGNKDPRGKLLFMEFVQVCKERGAGFVDYMWPKPGENDPVPKSSYVQLYKPWGWIVGSGIYVDDVRKEVAKVRWGILAGIALFALMVVPLAFSVGLGVVRPLRGVIGSLKEVADGDGDLSRRITVDREDESGELANAFNAFIAKLNGIMSEVINDAIQVATAAGQFQAASGNMAAGVEEVAAQAATVATAGEQMASTASAVADNCSIAADASRQASERAMSGAAVVQETVQVMNRISERVMETARTVDSLGSRSDQIGEIIGTIEDIADQTNLLALNAAIEAARAGDQGRGFAVVADEVRALAERTTRATKEIGQMIKTIQLETRGAVNSMEDGVKEVERGTEKAAKSGEALQEILNQINAVTMQVDQIATATEQQTSTTNEISRNILQITAVVNETAKEAAQSAAASSQLAGLADQLQRLVRRFTLVK